MEEWKPIPGYEGYYEISSHGRVCGLPREVKGKIVDGTPVTVCRGRSIKKTHITKPGYVVVSLSKEGVNKTYGVHRLVATVFMQNSENKPEVDHIDRVKTNNMVSNLRWATISENRRNRVVEKMPIGESGERYIIVTKQENYQVRINGICVGTFETLEEAKRQRELFITGE